MSILRRSLIKSIEETGKLGAVFKNRALHSTRAFSENLARFEECFAGRGANSAPVSVEALQRIALAYQLAIEDMHSRHFYYISNEWVPLYRQYQNEHIRALTHGNIDALATTYANFFRERISQGLCGLPTKMERFFNGRASNLDKLWYVGDFTHRLRILREKYPSVTPDDLATTDIGNPYGAFFDGVFVRTGAEYQYAFAQQANALLGRYNSGSLLEIGGGYGGMASYLARLQPYLRYINIDLPENLALATYYLMSHFPHANFQLYGETATANNANEPIFSMLPSFAIEGLVPKGAMIAFNSYSFAEMSNQAVANYIIQLARLEVKAILHINHTKNSASSADSFDFTSHGYALVSRERSAWNDGRNWLADEFEFLYEQESTG